MVGCLLAALFIPLNLAALFKAIGYFWRDITLAALVRHTLPYLMQVQLILNVT